MQTRHETLSHNDARQCDVSNLCIYIYISLVCVQKMESDSIPSNTYVPFHCTPRALRIARDDGTLCAYACPPVLIQKGRWYTNRFESGDETPAYYEAQHSDSFWLALRTLSNCPDEILDVTDGVFYDIAISQRFFSSKKQKKMPNPLYQSLEPFHLKRVICEEVHPSPGMRSGWARFVLRDVHG